METRHSRLVIAGLLLVLLIGAATAPSAPFKRTLRNYGIRLPLPAGWQGRVYLSGAVTPVLQASTRTLADESDDLGRRTQQAMRTGDLLIVLWELVPPRNPPPRWRRNFPAARAPIRVHGLSGPFEGQTAPASTTRGFRLAGRYFQLFAFFGTAHPGVEAFARVNTVLARLRIEPFSRQARERLRRGSTALQLVQGTGLPSGFRPLEVLHEVGTIALRCANGGVATAFFADPRGADLRATVVVDSLRRATRKMLPGKSVRTPPLRSHVHRWVIVQGTEPRTARAVITVEAPIPGHCYAVPAVLSSLRMTAH